MVESVARLNKELKELVRAGDSPPTDRRIARHARRRCRQPRGPAAAARQYFLRRRVQYVRSLPTSKRADDEALSYTRRRLPSGVKLIAACQEAGHSSLYEARWEYALDAVKSIP
jgi:hypothetical protein